MRQSLSIQEVLRAAGEYSRASLGIVDTTSPTCSRSAAQRRGFSVCQWVWK